MTENEAIKRMRNHTQYYVPSEDLEALEMAMRDMEEIRQYRALGTIEELKYLKEQFRPHQIDGTSCKHRNCNKCDKYRKENEKYHEIGTVEECRAAVDKQNAKKPDYEGDGYADGQLVYDTWICPSCGEKYEVEYDDYDHCPKCGQAIDWTEEGEE